MIDDRDPGNIYDYFIRELEYLSSEGQYFSKLHPAEARRLNVSELGVRDPHIDRLIESFAFLSARINRSIDQEYPQLIYFLMRKLYFNIVGAIPSCAIVTANVNEILCQNPLGTEIKANTLIETANNEGCIYEYRTVYPIVLWPITITEIKKCVSNEIAGLDEYIASPALSIELRRESAPINMLRLNKIRFYINLPDMDAHDFYEAIFTKTAEVVITDGENIITRQNADSIKEVGFEKEESLIQFPDNDYNKLKIILDFIFFERKFMFFDIMLDDASQINHILKINIIFKSGVILPSLNPHSIKLHCTPVINLSKCYSEPLRLSPGIRSHVLTPNIKFREYYEMHSIEKVYISLPGEDAKEVLPIFGFDMQGINEPIYWTFSQEESLKSKFQGADLSISIINHKFDPLEENETTVYAHLNCFSSNYDDLAEKSMKLKFSEIYPIKNVELLTIPSRPIKPLQDTRIIWALYSCLRFNSLSLLENNGTLIIKSILKTVNRFEQNIMSHNIDAIKNIKIDETAAQIGDRYFSLAEKGSAITLDLSKSDYSGGTPYLFAAVLERFMGGLAAINSFTQVTLNYTDTQNEVKKWPIRLGRLKLI